jgi:hypothetical protein
MAIIVLPYTFVPLTTIVAGQVNANNTAILTQVNGNIDNTNIAAAANISLTKLGLSPGGAAFNKTTTGAQTWGSGLTTDTQPRVVMFSDQGLQFGPGGATAPDVKLQRTATNTLRLAPPSTGTLITDSFAGAASTNLTAHTADTGNTWTATLGTIQLDGGGGVFCQAGTPAIYLASGTFNNILRLTWTLDCMTDVQFAGAGFIDGSGNMYYLQSLNSGTSGGGWRVSRLPSGGAPTTLSELLSTPLSAGQQYSVTFTYNSDSITVTLTWSVYQGTTLIWSSTTTDTTYPTATQCGLWASGAVTTTTGHHVGDFNGVYGGAGVLDMFGGDVDNPTNITMNDSTSVLNMNNGSITNVGSLTFFGGAVGLPGVLNSQINGFRVSISSTPGIPNDGNTSANTLYVTPYTSGLMGLYTGTLWNLYESTVALSVTIPGTTNTVYDVYAYVSSGAITIGLLAWSGINTPPTRGLQDGVIYTNGSALYRFLGSVMTGAVSAQIPDTAAQRFVWNWYNPIKRRCFAQDPTNSWTYGSSTIRASNANTTDGQGRLGILIGVVNQTVQATFFQGSDPSLNNLAAFAGIGVNSTTVATAQSAVNGDTTFGGNNTCSLITTLATAGYNALQMLEWVGPTGNNIDFAGDTAIASNSAAGPSFIIAEVIQ